MRTLFFCSRVPVERASSRVNFASLSRGPQARGYKRGRIKTEAIE
jgi:hypothetical protein